MSTKRTRARFIGQNGSMGLCYGTVYDIDLTVGRSGIIVEWGWWGYCPYSTMKALLKNWDFTHV